MELNHYIDHTNLNVTAPFSEIQTLCKEALENHFETVCVFPCYVKTVSELLQNSNVGITTVIGFPLGMNTTAVKEYEAINAIENGATEIDMVINLGDVKNHLYDNIKSEIEQIRDAIDGKTLKVIVETGSLTKDELIRLTEICNETYVNFIKTCTGFGPRGVTVEDVETIMNHKNEVLEVKASGGIKTYAEALELIEAGATRIGTSYAIDIIKEDKHETV